ncbi:MAG TPA: ribitol-5-phosphate dehydrogenase [Lachnoclostridium sp.]|jgi:ribitol-5-phosphate 2-dehydrogenase|uniref:zinc-binding dehydrogenase n=1 Tax=Lacrimispora sp. TaxID=2719234 RepID=UPI000EC9BF5F|nr:zinc-binding dehydrogenase [Lacrimispora sp.]HCD42866.1 ribitol-5-phosphate dehydrogenase [Lachnoclostridium sp.]
MINRIYRLMDTKRIEMVQRELTFDGNMVITRPEHISVCAADQRYYQGKRKREILRDKLPMALIHEATVTVMYDPDDKLVPGTKAVLIPLVPSNERSSVKANYDKNSEFMSSGRDGFLCDYIAVPREGIVPIAGDYSTVYVFSELTSVMFNALEAFEKACVTEKSSFGIWGDGSMGFIAGLVLRHMYPKSRIYIFGKTARKLQRFSFADETLYIDNVPKELHLDNCFECVGGTGSESALRQMIELTSPQGCISLLGVSEEEISVNTRSVLEKGLKLLGNSRSCAEDFEKAVDLIHGSAVCRKYLETLISDVIEIQKESDIARLFEQDILNDFKTVGKWLI